MFSNFIPFEYVCYFTIYTYIYQIILSMYEIFRLSVYDLLYEY